MHLANPLLHGLLTCLRRLELSPPALLAPAGLVEADLAAANPARAARALAALWHNAILHTGDPHLPFRVGSQLYVEQLGILGHILRNCEQLEAALGKLEKYNRLTNDFVEFRHQTSIDVAEISFCFSAKAPAGSFLRRVFTLLEIGFLVGGLAQLLHQPLAPMYVRCELPAEDRQYLQHMLGCPVEPATDTNLLAFDRKWLQVPILLPDPSFRQQLEHVADVEIIRIARHAPWADKIRLVLVDTLDDDKPDVKRVAAMFSVTVRALQRHLKAEDTSFQILAAEVRRTLALRYLRQPAYSVNEVAYLLGYAVPGAFSRAFKHWMGCSPLEFKAREDC